MNERGLYNNPRNAGTGGTVSDVPKRPSRLLIEQHLQWNCFCTGYCFDIVSFKTIFF